MITSTCGLSLAYPLTLCREPGGNAMQVVVDLAGCSLQMPEVEQVASSLQIKGDLHF